MSLVSTLEVGNVLIGNPSDTGYKGVVVRENRRLNTVEINWYRSDTGKGLPNNPFVYSSTEFFQGYKVFKKIIEDEAEWE